MVVTLPHAVRRRTRALLVLLPLVLFLAVIPLSWLVTGQRVPARVVSKHERVQVLPRTGMWYHEFSVTLQLAPASQSAPSDAERLVLNPAPPITLRTTQVQHDELRTGMPVDVLSLSLWQRFSWLGDESVVRAFAGHSVRAP